MPKVLQRISNIISDLMARRGLARIQGAEALETAWRKAAGPLAAQYTRVGSIRRGALEVSVANSTLVQELGYQKHDLLAALQKLLPEEKIKNIRFRTGNIDVEG